MVQTKAAMAKYMRSEKVFGREGKGCGGEKWRWRTLCRSVQRMWRVRTQTRPLTAKLGVLDVRRLEPSRGTVPQPHG